MNWFKKRPAPTLQEQLLEKRAELARVKQLLDSSFTIFRPPFKGGIIHGVDRKQAVIARLNGEIAYLETKLSTNSINKKDK